MSTEPNEEIPPKKPKQVVRPSEISLKQLSLESEQTYKTTIQQLICTFDQEQPKPKQTVRPSTITISKSVSTKQGYAVIFNHYKYLDENPGIREGTQHDVTQLQEVFDYFNIETHIKNDLKLSEIKDEIDNLKKMNFSNYQCFIMVILTHGDSKDILHAYDDKYEFTKEIEDPLLLEHTSLRDQPKIFMIQACRGTGTIPVIEKDSGHPQMPPQSVVAKRNIIKCYATYEGWAAHRIKEFGSPFILTLCQKLREMENDSIVDVMHSVIRDVSDDIENPQLPVLTLTSISPFYFQSLRI